MSFNLVRKDREGGSRMPMLKTLGSTKSLWPVAERSSFFSFSVSFVAGVVPVAARPGTDDLRMKSRSSFSIANSVDLLSVSASLNIRLFRSLV